MNYQRILAEAIRKTTEVAHSVLSPFVSEEKLASYKPIHLCAWYDKIGEPTPTYFIGTHVNAPSVSTGTQGTTTTTSVVMSGNNITNTGGANATVRGVCWVTGTGGTPTISNSTASESGSFGTGTYNTTMSGLATGTTYSVRAYATNSAGTGYGSTVEVTTTATTPPTVTTQAVSSISTTTATGNGNVTSDGGATITERGVCWNTTGTPTTANSKATSAGTTGAFTASMTGLTAGTLYYVRAYAINSQGTSYGGQVTFTTLTTPTVTTGATTNLETTSFTQAGNITNTGGVNATTRGVCYIVGSSGTPTISDTVNSESGSFGTGTFTRNLTGLTHSTSYRVRAFATNSVGTSYGSTITVTTATPPNDPPTVALNSPSDTVATYYFDGSGGISDPLSYWVNDSNAFNGAWSDNTNDYATSSGNHEGNASTSSSGYLEGIGTTAPSSGNTIISVRMRVAGNTNTGAGDGLYATVIDGTDEIGTAGNAGGFSNYGNYVVLSTPTGGWTWAKLQNLKARYHTNGVTITQFVPGVYNTRFAGNVQIEVTSTPIVTPTPTLEFTGTDPDGDDIRYNVQVDTSSGFGGVATYYFDGNGGINDPNSVWSNDANAFDSNTGTVATTTAEGGNNYLEGIGTNAPSSGGEISQVRVNGYGTSWGVYTTLTEPTGGWTWEKIRNLSVRFSLNEVTFSTNYGVYSDSEGLSFLNVGSTIDGTGRAARAEIEVTSYPLLDKTSNTDSGFANITTPADTDPFNSGDRIGYTVQSADTLSAGTYHWRVRGLDPSGSNTYGAWSDTRSFEVDAGGSVELVVANMTSGTSIENVALTQKNTLAVDNLASSTSIGNVVLIQSVTLTVDDLSSSTSIESVSVTQKNVLAVDNLSSSTTVENVALTQAHTLTVQNLTSDTTLESPALTQASTLTVDDLTSDTSVENTVLIQSITLTVQDMISGTTVENVTVTQKSILTVQNLSSTTVIEAVALTQKHALLVAHLGSATSAENVSLVQSISLITQDLSSSTSLESPALTQKHTLAVQDASSSTSVENTTLTQKHLLSVADSSSATSIENVVLSQSTTLTVQDLASTTSIENVAVTQKNTLAVQDATLSTSVEEIGLIQKHSLVVDDLSSLASIENVVLTQATTLTVESLSSSTTLEAVALTQKHTLEVQSLTSETSLENTVLAEKQTLSPNNLSSSTSVENVELAQAAPLNDPPTLALNSPANLATVGSTPTLEFTGTDSEGDDIQYNIQISQEPDFLGGPFLLYSRFSNTDSGFLNTINGADTDPFNSGEKIAFQAQEESVDTYYFDGHIAINDPNSVWTDDANAFNGNTANFASTTAAGISTSNFLEGKGATAPSTGGSITQVRFRVRDSEAYSSYVTLSAPAGGWTWDKVQKLESRSHAIMAPFDTYNTTTSIYAEGEGGGTALGTANTNIAPSADVSIVELEVTSTPLTELDDGTYYWRVRGLDPTGSNTYGAWSSTRSFTVETNDPPTVTTQDLSLGLSIDEVVIDQEHLITVNDISHSLTVDATTITQNHVIATNDISLDLSLDNTTIAQNHVIATQDISLSLTTDSTTLTQNQIIQTADIVHALILDTTTLVQNHILSPADLSHDLSIEEALLDMFLQILTQDINLGLSLDTTTISQNHIIDTQDLSLALTVDEGGVDIFVQIITQNILHSLSIDNTTVTQEHIISPADLTHSLEIDEFTLTQNHIIDTQDISLYLTLDEAVFGLFIVLETDNILFNLTLDIAGVTQDYVLTTQDISLFSSLDTTTLLQDYNLSVDELLFTLGLGTTAIAEQQFLNSSDISLGISIENTSITQNHVIANNNILISPFLDRVDVIKIGFPEFKTPSGSYVRSLNIRGNMLETTNPQGSYKRTLNQKGTIKETTNQSGGWIRG